MYIAQVSDLFHVLPFKYLPPLRNALDISTKRGSTAGHFIYDNLVDVLGSAAINFIEPRGRSSNVLEFDPLGTTFLYISRSCDGIDTVCPQRPLPLLRVCE